ncbi:TetR/AcrR family transcriptional regulator [Nocardioides daeguensis]|uniref:TetR/AcrR family transcriptional regulator n=1 Tax=Nocardioides daeguensis TaxID=908359 RepID=A0ABP6VFS5_9ACTN|nr:TetR/AcrR family transcriptional regulator [Nocardioides daeguensis]MBV6729478.1 TetR/AcrR family transcriptional regulator [Nocardioides daeguensis]MCR1771749.1 TetR/AcrR family transcriptional regulator [Nocardioides daeguensis]
MPRITAPTVAAHREQQLRAVLDSARAILGETRQAPTLAATAQRAGLARSSIYRYFASREELLAAVVADVFPEWAGQVRARVEAATTPGEKVWAYVCANIDLFSSSEQDVASALSEVADPHLLKEPMEAFHAELQRPLVAALVAHGEPHAQLMAETIESALVHVARRLGEPVEDPLRKDQALALLRRLLGGYLQRG